MNENDIVENKEEKEKEEKEKENKKSIVIIDFMAKWCGPCRMQDPIIETLKKKFEDKVEFRKVDIDENYELANRYTIQAVPTLIIEKDGKLLKRYIGVTPLKELEKIINDALL